MEFVVLNIPVIIIQQPKFPNRSLVLYKNAKIYQAIVLFTSAGINIMDVFRFSLQRVFFKGGRYHGAPRFVFFHLFDK